MPAFNPLTPAEALAQRLAYLGASVFITVQPEGQASFTFGFPTNPPSKAASSIAALILQRVADDEQFRSDLFAWLAANGRLFRRAADPLPDQPLDENWSKIGDAAGSVVAKLADRFCHRDVAAVPASRR